MKYLLLLIASIAVAQTPQPIARTLFFTYPGVITPSTAAHAYSSVDVTAPLANWIYLGSVTNLQAASNGVPIQLRWRQEFFVVAVSNEYTIGGLSNLVFSDVLTSAPPVAARSQIR